MIEPVGHRVLVEIDDVAERTSGGIYIPDTARSMERMASQVGTVISVGPIAWFDKADGKPWCKKGDRVYFAKYGGLTVKEKDREFRLLNDEDILGIIREDG